MSKTVLRILTACILSFNAFGQSPPVVYFDFLSHDEDTGPWNGSTYYNGDRAKLINLVTYFQSKGITYNMQSDFLYLNNVIAKETGTMLTVTNNKNILRWMVEDMGVEIDPHAHENSYIYPDVVKLMDSIGLPESKLMGGSLYAQKNGTNCWMNLVNGQNGVIFPSRFWKPDYMMGGGTPAHVADLKYYGFWNPKDTDNYLTHDPLSPLKHIGVGCEIKLKNTDTVAVIAAKLRDVINKVQSGQYPSSGFYVQTIFFGHGDLNNTTFYNKLVQLADSANAIVATGKAQWKTLKQAYTIWQGLGSQTFQWECGQVTGINESAINNINFKIYPNPASGSFKLKLDVEMEDLKIIISNSLGQKIMEQPVKYGTNEIQTSHMNKGLYHYILSRNSQTLKAGSLAVE